MRRVLGICFFTDEGRALAEKISKNYISFLRTDESLEYFIGECFDRRLPVIFIGAAGIAVRAASSFVKDKLYDSPVIVIDEKGQYVIPILSGHVGRGNEIAKELAVYLGAQAIITTATDVEHKFSVDVFAVNHSLKIYNREGIRYISSKILAGQKVKVYLEPVIIAGKAYIDISELEAMPELEICEKREEAQLVIATKADEKDKGLQLIYKKYVLGMGCKRNKSIYEIKAFLDKHRDIFDIYDKRDDIYALTSIDVKSDEPGLNELAQYLNVPFITYPAEELQEVPGQFTESEFVRNTVGVGSVCERSAMKLLGNSGCMVHRKISDDGITMCIAQRYD